MWQYIALMYSFLNFELVHCSLSGSNCCFLTCIQISQEEVRWLGIPVSWRIFHSLLWSTVKTCSLVNEAEVDIFLEFSCFFYDPTDVGNWSLVPPPFLNPAWTSENSWFMYSLKPKLERFWAFLASMWNECNCAGGWTFFDIALLWDWNENWPFPVLWPVLSFPNLLTYWVQHFHGIIF